MLQLLNPEDRKVEMETGGMKQTIMTFVRALSQSEDRACAVNDDDVPSLLWSIPVGIVASVRREWMSSTASVSSIFWNDIKWLHLSAETVAYKCFYLYRYTPPGQRHPSFHVRGPVLTLRLSFPSVSGKVWNVALAQESESPPLPLSAPASQKKKKDTRPEQTGCQSKHLNTTAAAAANICISH